MTISLNDAVVYDCETFPNVFTLHMEMLNSSISSTWEISQYRDDRWHLLQWFNHLRSVQAPMIGFNNEHFDYQVIHFIMCNPHCTVEQIYAKAMSIIKGDDRFAGMIWDRDRFTPQIDLFKIHHMDNKAKTTSLKALEINMRSPNVVDMPVKHGTILTEREINELLIPYNRNDVSETKRFAHISKSNIDFRLGLIDQFGVGVLNYSDVKIGVKIFEQRLGEDICYDRSTGRKSVRQTIRHRIPLAEIIFPYIQFNNPEFRRVLEWMKLQVLTPDDLDDPDALIKTKGVFKGITASVGGIDFYFGTGGIHGSIPAQRLQADDHWLIRDIDVKALYPSIAIVNKLAPEHLGEAFTRAYPEILAERAKHKKGTVKNAALKLAANGPWGQSNNPFTFFFDSKYAMTIPINGQLMLCMLAEWLMTVPSFQIIQINTDGITYRIHASMEPQAAAICKKWEAFTLLELEDANYSRMWIRDVNNYIAEDAATGKLKQKGAYWHPEAGERYAPSISEASPSAWHKDLGGIVSIKAAVAAMVKGIDPETFIRLHSDPFDFMLRVKADKASHLMLDGVQVQNTTRYYVAKQGGNLTKISPPAKGAQVGEFKRRSGLTDQEYERIAATVPFGTHDPRIHTKNKSKHEIRTSAIEAGWKVAICNRATDFDFANVDFGYYINEARKLII